MYKRFVLSVCVAVLALLGRPVFAEDAPDVFVCTKAEHAEAGAFAMRSLHLFDASGLRITKKLKKNKKCWFETVSVPKKYTPLSRLYVEEGYSSAYVVVSLEVNGVTRYVVFFEDGSPEYEI